MAQGAIMLNREYYKSTYNPGDWRSGLTTNDMRVQVKQVMDKQRLGMHMAPYESTAAALGLILNKADAFFTQVLEEHREKIAYALDLERRISELEQSLKEAHQDITTLRDANATLQSEVERPVGQSVPHVAAKGAGSKPAGIKPPAAGNKPVVGKKR